MIGEVKRGTLDYVPPNIVDTQWCLLRHVEPSTIQFQDLKNSIKERGVLETILVRRLKLSTGEVILSLIDGLNRLTAAQELALPTIPCNILDNVDDDEAISLQIQANLFQIQTRPADYAKAIKFLIERNKDTMSIGQLAKLTNCRVSYLRELLKVTKLPDNIQNLVNEGVININNALILSQLPAPELYEWVELAQKKPKDFKILAMERLKEIRVSTIRTRDDGVWEPHPIIRKRAQLEAEVNEPKIVKQLITTDMLPEEAFKIGIQYALSMDPITVEQRREARDKLLREDAEKRSKGVKKRAEERLKILELEMAELQKKIEMQE